MNERQPIRNHTRNARANDLMEQDDVRAVLAALHELAEQTQHPVVRACLEQAHDDILHLTTCGDEALGNEMDDDEAAAA